MSLQVLMVIHVLPLWFLIFALFLPRIALLVLWLIVPVAHDSGYYWPRRGLLKKPGTIRVVIGPPIAAAGTHTFHFRNTTNAAVAETGTAEHEYRVPEGLKRGGSLPGTGST